MLHACVTAVCGMRHDIRAFKDDAVEEDDRKQLWWSHDKDLMGP